MQALVFANGDLNPGPMVDRALSGAANALRVAADGGARHMLALDLPPQVVIGDMDSLGVADLAVCVGRGAIIHRYPAAKNETDLELALLYVVAQGADVIHVIGAMGNRLDQMLANILLLTLSPLRERDVRLVAGRQMAWVLPPGTHRLHGTVGDTLSLLPLGGDSGAVTTSGLRYALQAVPLLFGPARGVSNVFVGPEATVTLADGLLFVVHTLGRA